VTDILSGTFSRDNTATYIAAYESAFTRDGESTVSFSGQTTRLKQAKEIGADLKGNSGESTLAIESRFTTGNGFDDTTLDYDTTGKKVENKVSASIGLFSGDNETQGDTNLALVASFITGYDAVSTASSTLASAGNAGYVDDADGSTRYVDAKGYELDQLFTKSLSGALAYDQTVNHYFNRLDDNFDGTENWKTLNDAGTVAEGKSYTTMEHHWDEAFGYIYGNISGENLIYKYIDNVDALDYFTDFEYGIFEAFVEGRIAIVDKDYDARDAAIASLREDLSTVIAVRAVNYIVAGANFLDDSTNTNRVQDALHDLSEGYGFVNSLRYIVDADGALIFTDAEVDAYLAILDANNGVWTLDAATLITDIAEEIAAKFDWSVSDVKTVEVVLI